MWNMFRVNDKDTSSSVFIVSFEHVSPLDLVFLPLNLNMYLPSGNTSPWLLLWVNAYDKEFWRAFESSLKFSLRWNITRKYLWWGIFKESFKESFIYDILK